VYCVLHLNGLALAIGPVARRSSPKGPSKQVRGFSESGQFTGGCGRSLPERAFRKRRAHGLPLPLHTALMAHKRRFRRLETGGRDNSCQASLTLPDYRFALVSGKGILDFHQDLTGGPGRFGITLKAKACDVPNRTGADGGASRP